MLNEISAVSGLRVPRVRRSPSCDRQAIRAHCLTDDDLKAIRLAKPPVTSRSE